MKVGPSGGPSNRSSVREGGVARRHTRTAFRERVRAVREDGEFESETEDISKSGVGLLSDAMLDNSAFVELHIGEVGVIPGHVARTYEGGFAVEFDVSEKEKERIEAEIKRFRRTLAREEEGNEV
jgi:hypothetical protein